MMNRREDITEQELLRQERENAFYGVVLCFVGLAINLIGVQAATLLKMPLFLDSIGTMLTGALGGSIPGIAVGFLTNFINGLSDPATAYYTVLNVAIAVFASFCARKHLFESIPGILMAIVCFALIGGGVGSVMTWFLYGAGFGEGISAPLAHTIYNDHHLGVFWSQFIADMIIDVLDKTVSVLLVSAALRLLPEELKKKLYLRFWRQRPLTDEERRRAQRDFSRGLSLRGKVMVMISAACILIAVVITSVSLMMYHQSNIAQQMKLAKGVAGVALSNIDPERVDEFMEQGEAAPDYLEVKKRLGAIMESSDDIEYVYVYKILEDGCHVVFDPDTPEIKGEAPGTVIPFDEAFGDYLPALLAGEEIDPVISDETYGWLLTVYEPVYNSQGECVCYVGADISMNHLAADERVFLVRVVSLFVGFFILILSLCLWLAEYFITLPINTMAIAAGGFAYNSAGARAESLNQIRRLNIHTGDEIENLYHAITRTTEDTVDYIVDAQRKNETISKLQSGIIMVLADLVESRDKCTGDHVRKTAAYTRIIMDQMRREGYYADQLTDEFCADVFASAPLHDLGKIKVSDAVLNKPGRLTDDEFAMMRNHTTEGGVIIEGAIGAVSEEESGYLKEARNLALYHHEKWNGTGYPKGLKGEEIPLSARIMAVADVFDALVSTRSYKKGFPIEKALSIIREGAGSHFDPYVVKAFLDAEDQVREVAARHEESTMAFLKEENERAGTAAAKSEAGAPKDGAAAAKETAGDGAKNGASKAPGSEESKAAAPGDETSKNGANKDE